MKGGIAEHKGRMPKGVPGKKLHQKTRVIRQNKMLHATKFQPLLWRRTPTTNGVKAAPNHPTSRRAAAGSLTEQNTKVDTTASNDPDSNGSSSATPPSPRRVRPSCFAFASAFSRASDGSPDSAGSTPTERGVQGAAGSFPRADKYLRSKTLGGARRYLQLEVRSAITSPMWSLELYGSLGC